ncbi:rhodanese-like domain-containing protein [Pseudorhodoferax sp. Leaf267]|uniref:rhodanese-like domain-containing protein n=1 Tax=Pseudorhodoferax sp. Leaf267 TaxID=1736316 RepID=UPI0006FC4B12|nr:rhodanese-like domain-containing protein [Pseudorhodoferax sp. Leaf267]KQP17610.1 sulfurtransferase [Pseudorhodoferax sp. Leaf267]
MNFVIDNWMLFAVALVSGGMLLWPMVSGAAGASALTANGAVQLINREKAVVVDVREAEEFAGGHIVGAKNVPVAQLEERLPAVVKNKGLPLLLVCPTGARANKAVAVARKLGYEKAQAIGGGMKGWRDAGLPLEKA